MQAVEFQTTVNADGSIDIPSMYRPQIHGKVRVIILSETSPAMPSVIQQLLHNPRRVDAFTPFTRDEIYDRSQ